MGEKQGFQKMQMSPQAGRMEQGGTKEVLMRKPLYKRRKCRICCGVCFLVVLAFGIVAIVLSQTIFKFKDPGISLNSVKLEGIKVSVDLPTFSVVLNVTLDADVRVDNPNHYSFRYDNSTMLMTYHGQQVGDIALGAGYIRSQKTVDIPARITVEAAKIVEDFNALTTDLTSGVVSQLGLSASIPGRVNVAGIYKKHVVTTLNCTIDVFIANQTVKDTICVKRVKL